MFKSKSETKNINELLQEDKKHILVPTSQLADLNSIADLTKVNQQRLTAEILKIGLQRMIRKYHLNSSN